METRPTWGEARVECALKTWNEMSLSQSMVAAAAVVVVMVAVAAAVVVVAAAAAVVEEVQ